MIFYDLIANKETNLKDIAKLEYVGLHELEVHILGYLFLLT
jgi:hypothetical protein